MKHKITLIRGVGGLSLYVNDMRVCGPKPWGGGTIEKEWTATDDDFAEALRQRTAAPRPNDQISPNVSAPSAPVAMEGADANCDGVRARAGYPGAPLADGDRR